MSDPRANGKNQFAVLATSGAFLPGYLAGGPIRSLTHLVETMPATVSMELLTRDRDHGGTEAYAGLGGNWRTYNRTNVFYLDVSSIRQWTRLLRHVRSGSYDCLYLNSLLSPFFSLFFILLYRCHLVSAKALVIAPRGELAPGALAQKTRKKQLILPVLRGVLRRPDVYWHATSDMEAGDIRAAFPSAIVITNGNQSSVPTEVQPPTRPSEGDKVRLVFLSRITPKKNLKAAVTALRDVDGPVTLDIFGPIEDAEYWRECQTEADRLPDHVTVTYCGTVDPTKVRATFSRYDGFLFPTLGENFGHVIPESLSSSCPVLCSDQTPWTDTLREGGGLVFEIGSHGSLRTMLQSFCNLGPEARQEARMRAARAYLGYRRTTANDAYLFDQLRERITEGTSA